MFLSVNPAVFCADVWTDVTSSLILSHLHGWNLNFGRQDGSRNGPSRVFRQEVRRGWSLMMGVVALGVSKDKMPWNPQAPQVALGGVTEPSWSIGQKGQIVMSLWNYKIIKAGKSL